MPCGTVWAYLVLLRAEIARFTRQGCPWRLVSVALILTSRWRGVTSCAVLCSPDVPPVRRFRPTLARRSCDLHQRRPGELHAWIIARG